MLLFHGRFPFDKFTDEKFRWKLDVNGVEFKIYITQDRVPLPASKIIDVIVLIPPDSPPGDWYTYKLTRLGSKSFGALLEQEKKDLEAIGLSREQIQEMSADSIIGSVQRAEDDHTETVRYNAFRGSEAWEFGDPYIPKSLFKNSYPMRLLFMVQWVN